MKKLLTLTSIFAVSLFAMASAQAELKIATVDMDKIFSAYHKTKDADVNIKSAQANAKQEFETRMESYKKISESIAKLNEEIGKPELSSSAKAEKSKLREEKLDEAKKMEQEITSFRTNREKQLREQAVRMRDDLVEEINEVIAQKIKSDGYDIVFDKSGVSTNSIKVVYFAKDTLDFSDQIIATINKGAKTGSAPAKK